jgi:quercetin dioxygenase-like cupin family protein
MRIVLFALVAAVCSGVVSAAAAPRKPPGPVVTRLMTQALKNAPGKEALMLTVEYPPGGADPVHRHDAEALVYVLEGSIVMGVAGGKPVTLHAGETFHEGPDDVHTIGRNASDTKPAKFVVVLVKDIGKPALIPVD